MKKIYKKNDLSSINFFFGYSINMLNLQQNEIEQIQKETDLLVDRVKKNEKTESI